MKKNILWSLLLPLALLSSCGGDEPKTVDPPKSEFEDSTFKIVSDANMPGVGTIISEFADSPIGSGLKSLVDGNNSTEFVTSHDSFYIQYEALVTYPVNSYSIVSAADSPEKDPKSWTLSGSNDKATWTELDSQTNYMFAGRGESAEFEFDNAREFKYVRLSITANNGGEGVQVAEYSLGYFNMNINDIMAKADGRSNSSITPMGTHFQNRHVTTADDIAWFADATKEPDASQAGDFEWKEFFVTLYPTSGGEPVPADCNQHGIGDCSAIAVFGSFAYIYPDFIKDIITDNGNNTYTVDMFDPTGAPIEVTVSNKFSADRDGNIQAVTGKDNVACWSTVLEKAMMKWQKVYQANYNIGGIGTEHVAPLFTGNGNSFAFSPGKLTNAELERVVDVLLRQGQLVIGGFRDGGTPIDAPGYSGVTTVNGHAYTFMHPHDNSVLCVMRNPWGGHNGNIPGSADGQINIPDNNVVPPIIDLRVVEPGKAANYGSGTKVPYTPPTFSAAQMVMRVSSEIMRAGGN
jgi:hypothetical protein